MNRRTCARGVLAKEGSSFDHLQVRKKVDKFPEESRDPYSDFSAKRDSASVSYKLNCIGTESLLGGSCSMIAIVNSNTLAKNPTFRTLGGLRRLGGGCIIILGSGTVSVGEGMNNLSGCLKGVHASSTCASVGVNIAATLRGIPIVKRRVISALHEAGDDVGRLIVPNVLFRGVKVACLNPISNRGVPRVVHVLRRTGQFRKPILIRIVARGKENCTPTLGRPTGFRNANPCILQAKRPGGGSNPSCSRTIDRILLRRTKEGGGVITIATTVGRKAKLSGFTRRCPGHFFSINVTRKRTIAFTTNLTLKKLVPIFTMCSSFLREKFSRLVRSVYVRGLPSMFLISQTKLINSSKEDRRNYFSLSCLSLVPGVAIVTPGGSRRLGRVIQFTLGTKDPITVHCPENTTYARCQRRRRPLRAKRSRILIEKGSMTLLTINAVIRVTKRIRGRFLRRKVHVALIGTEFMGPLSCRLLGSLTHSRRGFIALRRGDEVNKCNRRMSSCIRRTRLPIRARVYTIPSTFINRNSIS